MLFFFILLISLPLSYTQKEEETFSKEYLWSRWEKRTIECVNGTRGVECTLVAPNAIPPRDPSKYKCRVETMPKTEWNTLAKASTRVMCPIGCEPDADLSVITKVPANNTKCQKYYTYGKFRNVQENEWYLWLTEPCVASLTTHCRFKDVPAKGLQRKQRTQRKRV